jgi:hypothetical protein
MVHAAAPFDRSLHNHGAFCTSRLQSIDTEGLAIQLPYVDVLEHGPVNAEVPDQKRAGPQ